MTVTSLVEVMSRAGESPEVVLEAAYGWYWAADALAELGATVHLAHPLGVKAFSYGRVKNDQMRKEGGPRRHRGRSPNARSGVARAEWTTRSARRSHPRQSSRCARRPPQHPKEQDLCANSRPTTSEPTGRHTEPSPTPKNV